MATLYLVATPIGNLEDFSPRAVRTLRSVGRIGCEDTRVSGKLLAHYGIEQPTFSFHQHNEHKKLPWLLDQLAAGIDLALITDAGMPGISDPGFLAARAAHQNGYNVVVIPGPDACTTALAASGLPSDRYHFEGFLPLRKGRKTRLAEISAHEITTVLYESPHRLLRLLDELAEAAGTDRMLFIARELTKKFEETQRGTVGQLREHWRQRDAIKGEFVLVLAGKSYRE